MKNGIQLSWLKALILLVMMGLPTYGASINGNIVAGYKMNRPNSFTTLSGVEVYFQVIPFRVGTAVGDVQVTATASGWTPRIFFYQNASFNPFQPLNNLFAFGSGNVTAQSLLHGIDIDHYVVITGDAAGNTGPVTVNINGPSGSSVTINTGFESALSVRTQPRDAKPRYGQSVTLTTWASGKQPHTFQWYRGTKPATGVSPNPANAISGATGPSYTTPAMTVAEKFWCEIQGNATTPSSTRTREAIVTPLPNEAVFTGSWTVNHDTWKRMQELSVYTEDECRYEVTPFRIYADGNYTFTLKTTNSPGAINIFNTKFFPLTPAVNFWAPGQAQASAGTLTYTTFMAAGDYELVISTASPNQLGTYGVRIDGTEVAEILPRPTLLTFLNSAVNITVITNTSGTLGFSVEGALPRTIQWYQGQKGDTSRPIGGANNKYYTTPVLPNKGTNNYWVRISNSYGSLDSETIEVAVGIGRKLSGNLRVGNKLWRRAEAGAITSVQTYYKTYWFQPTTMGNYTISLVTTGFNGTLSLYQSIFDTNNSKLNLYKTAVGTSNVTMNVGFAFPSMFCLVVSSTREKAVGTYGFQFAGPALVNYFPPPEFTAGPTPSYQFQWLNEATTPLSVQANMGGITNFWYPSPNSTPVDNLGYVGVGTTYNPGTINNLTPVNYYYWPRVENQYGYEDGNLARIEVGQPPTHILPNDLTFFARYGSPGRLRVPMDNRPFYALWYEGFVGNQSIVSGSNFFQPYGDGMNYQFNADATLTVPSRELGDYNFWAMGFNPSGSRIPDGRTLTLRVQRRDLRISFSVPAERVYNGTPQGISGYTLSDPNPDGHTFPTGLPVEITYRYQDGTVSPTPPTDAGTHQVIGVLNHTHYFASATNSFVIKKVALTVSTPHVTKVPGQTIPAFSVTITGFISGESSVNLSSLPVASTQATQQSPVGVYPISFTGGSARNYEFNYTPANLYVFDYPVLPAWQSDFSIFPTNEIIYGGASLSPTEKTLYLTGPFPGQNGGLHIPSLGKALQNFYAHFDAFVGAGNGADGFSFNYHPSNPSMNLLMPEEGIGNGLSLTVDTWNNPGEFNSPSIGLSYAGQILRQVTVSGLRNNLRRFTVQVSTNGLATVWHGTNIVMANVEVPGWAPQPNWSFTFGARTGGSYDIHSIQNVLIGERVNPLQAVLNSQPITLHFAPMAPLPGFNFSVSSISNSSHASFAVNGSTAIVSVAQNTAGQSAWKITSTNPQVSAEIPLQLQIAKQTLGIQLVIPDGLVYDGYPHAASYTFIDAPVTGLVAKLSYNGNTNPPINAGTYAVSAVLEHPLYQGSAQGTITILRRDLTVSVGNFVRNFGDTNENYSLTYAGFADGESAANLAQSLSLLSPSFQYSPVGNYPIIIDPIADANYALRYNRGTLTILGLPAVAHYLVSDTSIPTNVSLIGHAVAIPGGIRLTAQAAGQYGAMHFPAPKAPIRNLHVEFDMIIGMGTGADGMSFNYAPGLPSTSFAAEEGPGQGLTISIDTYNNGGELTPSIAIKYNGSVVAERLWNVRTSDWKRLTLDVSTNGIVSLRHGNDLVFDAVYLLNWDPQTDWSFMIAARTGGLHDLHGVNNIFIGERVTDVVVSSERPTILALDPAYPMDSHTYGILSNGNPHAITASILNRYAVLTLNNPLTVPAQVAFQPAGGSIEYPPVAVTVKSDYRLKDTYNVPVGDNWLVTDDFGATQSNPITFSIYRFSEGNYLLRETKLSKSAPLGIFNRVAFDKAGDYRVLATNSGGTIQADLVLNVIDWHAEVKTFKADIAVNEGDPFSLSASQIIGNRPFTFSWAYRATPTNDWSILSANTEVYTVNPATLNHTGQYRMLVSNGLTTASNPPGIAIFNVSVRTTPVITKQPKSITLFYGGTARLFIFATGGDLKYQWQQLNGGTWNSLAGQTNDVLTIAPATASASYRCIVSNPVLPAGLASRQADIEVDMTYVSASGLYNGLVETATEAGSLSLTLKENGSFSGKISFPTRSSGFSGKMDATGIATATVLGKTLKLSTSLTNPGAIFGRYDSDTETNALLQLANGSGINGQYHVLIPGAENGDLAPAGTSFAVVKVNGSTVSVSGTLADGVGFTQTTTVSANSMFPLYAPLYGGKGSVHGWVNLTNPASGTVIWRAEPNASPIYSDGFELAGESHTSLFVPASGIIEPGVYAVVIDGPYLSEPVVAPISISAGNVVSYVTPRFRGFSFQFLGTNGAFKGSVSISGFATPYKGVIDQPGRAGDGHYITPAGLGAHQRSGSVSLHRLD